MCMCADISVKMPLATSCRKPNLTNNGHTCQDINYVLNKKSRELTVLGFLSNSQRFSRTQALPTFLFHHLRSNRLNILRIHLLVPR